MNDISINTKKLAAEKAVEYITSGMHVGLGTGSTAYWAIQKVGELVKNGMDIKAVATSLASETQARELGIPIISFAEIDFLDITIDGADEIDLVGNLIKGGGGALLREKIVAAATGLYVIIADEKKFVHQLGAFPLPVEVVPFGWEITYRQIASIGCQPVLRLKGNEPFLSDNGHYIIDCHFSTIKEPEFLELQLNGIPGVMENGLFVGMTDIIILGTNDGGTRVMELEK